jgi:Uma2 family endonuclease
MASKVKHLMTIDDLEAIPYDETHRYELIEGELYVSRAPGIPHQLVLHHLQRKLGNYLEQNPIGILVPGPGAVFDKFNSVIPDIVFARTERLRSIVAKARFNAAPDLVIEIVSPGSTNYSRDFDLKRTVYEKFGVPEYWIVDCWSRSVVIFRLEEDSLKEVTRFNETDALESPIFPGLSLKLSKIFMDDLSAFLT